MAEALTERSSGVGGKGLQVEVRCRTEEYQASGAELVSNAADAWSAQMVVKVKEPIHSEYQYLRDNQILFTYLHLAAEPGTDPGLAQKWDDCHCLRNSADCQPSVAVADADGGVAGRMATRWALPICKRTMAGVAS